MDTLTSKVARLVRGQHSQRLAASQLRERLTAQLGPKREGARR